MFTFRILRLAAVLALSLGGTAGAQDISFFRIATGSTSGTYYPIGGLIANAISAPPGARPCAQGGSCGVPGLVASALSSTGSVANVEAIASGAAESAFVQGDIAAWAHSGTGIWADRPPVEKLRAIANLYPESIHLVADRDAGIAAVTDLRGKRVSLDEPGSGTLVGAQIILAAAGLAEDDLQPEYLRLDEAAHRMKQGEIDAFFFVGGAPAGAIAELAAQQPVTIVPIKDSLAQQIVDEHPFFTPDLLPAGTYEGQQEEIATISVGAKWVTSADQPEELIYAITQALWSDATRRQLDAGHLKGRSIVKERALEGIAIPVHPGAERFYRETGLMAAD
ncbi:TAXI family TRAP transporter solute-binding subunit [Paracoccus methylovorus]|uniref:TAXI family TRAP transporter solute-binding subunit n=1 Tax=Paracoccus methylovorus TaxID=2812658 RepID=A0ABX7JFN7_9RHOB|nr:MULTISPECIES: TAXI family TRAP transporter solute-binding subunit [Paracoccus]QRZ13058.1 TAXI family TRAP transporter solute-binding subunit [Paracoccus methylovorus]